MLSSSEINPSTTGSPQLPQHLEWIDISLGLFKLADWQTDLSLKKSMLNTAETYLQARLAAFQGTDIAQLSSDIRDKLTLMADLRNRIISMSL